MTRKVFPPAEVAHLWANQAQESGRNAGDTFSFHSGTLYSYNVKTGDKVGHYTVSEVNNGDSLQIGCHTITRVEAERFARSVGWLTSDTVAA